MFSETNASLTRLDLRPKNAIFPVIPMPQVTQLSIQLSAATQNKHTIQYTCFNRVQIYIKVQR